jgi:type IV conjugative transfer system coupling protein TraD
MPEVLKKDQGFKGFETWLTSVKMRFKMHLYIGIAFLLVQLIITLAASYIFHGGAWRLIFNYGWTGLKSFDFTAAMEISKYAGLLALKSIWIFILSGGIWFFYPGVVLKFNRRAKEQAKDRYIRGARLSNTEDISESIKKDGEEADLPIGNIRMPVSAEPKHCFIIGRPGVGKTVSISQIIDRLKERRAKGIIYDFKGDYLSRFYDPKSDIIFNPLDQRCLGWTLFNEIHTYMDVDACTHSLIPPPYQNDPFWNDGARDVFAGILHYLYQNGAKTNKDIWEAVTAPGTDIAKWLQHTKGGERGLRYIEDASSKMAMSVFAVMMQYVKAFEYMSTADSDFSVKEWLENERPGFIFITNYSDIKDTLKPILSLFVDLMGRKLLSMKDDYNRRIFFMLDELGTLQRLSTIVQLLTLSRSKGGSCWLGIQDIGQMDKIYTQNIRQAIVNACGSNLIFSVADPDTAKFLSDKIGDTEYIETEETYSMGTEDSRDGISLIRRKKTEKLVLPSDIQNLKDLNAYLKLPNYDISKVEFRYKSYPDKHEPFLMKPEFNLENIILEQAKILAEVKEVIDPKDRAAEKKVENKKDKQQDRDDRDYAEEIENEII